ncbi:ATP-binding cassette domain-containing protein [Auraticoccus sp. F435]|uniref:ATP-binding cassette domain-containing protein n=1 Tax=Auraticoccus cholistanensis TaxID=2656650 RepID=A0A6A9UQJ9_9ACTN|nr:ABC transporter ATP-binding protein [Auraticoccus cholistanensis]MVA74838.1 ATP-binding cassette domain-containing protein [Auraticoccus cholistanensis]
MSETNGTAVLPLEPDWREDSARTWVHDTDALPRVPAELVPPEHAGPRERLRAWRRRHRIRAERADSYYHSTRAPERGLPVAPATAVVGFVSGLLRRRRSRVVLLLALNVAAAVAGLVVPRMLGSLVDRVSAGDTVLAGLNALALAVVGVVVLQALLVFGARFSSTVVGQDVLASAREDVVETVLSLPLGRVESASSGDLVTRVTRDVSAMSNSVQYALPQAVIAAATTVLTIVALVLNSPLLAVPSLVALVLVSVPVRRYLRAAPRGYITEGGTYSRINTTFTETVEGARTVEALDLQRQRIAAGDDDVAESAQAERYTMSLRNLMFGWIDLAYNTPLVAVLLLGTYGYSRGWVTLGEITTATLYVQALVEPVDRLIANVDRLQVGIASTTRLLGIRQVPQDRTPGEERPDGVDLVGRDLRFAYREGRDVLHGVDLALRPRERLAVVGPSGSGKSTLGRLLAGINGPRTGSVTVGGVELTSLPLDVLRTEVALVTQEHHVFVGTVRDNIVLAREDSPDEVVIRALQTVDAWEWVQRLPEGLDTMLGSGHTSLTPAQAQQVALARLVVADPHTLVLDEATSLIDPRTARDVEGSMNGLLENRAVVAIAHRLHTAHDADRIAVVIDGRIAELGSHEELVERDGEYAALWRAWTS